MLKIIPPCPLWPGVIPWLSISKTSTINKAGNSENFTDQSKHHSPLQKDKGQL
jgi:hypothetical protein